eukprot:scaffold82462_cov32-Attheya_sp.AAC.1
MSLSKRIEVRRLSKPNVRLVRISYYFIASIWVVRFVLVNLMIDMAVVALIEQHNKENPLQECRGPTRHKLIEAIKVIYVAKAIKKTDEKIGLQINFLLRRFRPIISPNNTKNGCEKAEIGDNTSHHSTRTKVDRKRDEVIIKARRQIPRTRQKSRKPALPGERSPRTRQKSRPTNRENAMNFEHYV